MSHHSRFLLLGASLSVFLFGAAAGAEPSAESLHRAFLELPDGGERLLKQTGVRGRSGGASLVARVASRAEAHELSLIPITSSIAVGTRSLADWRGMAERAPAHFAPERNLLSDRAAETIGLFESRDEFGLTGQGVVVGIVDTGLDVAHPSFRNADGSTRVRWMLAFGQEPRGAHPELEEEFGCNGEDPCAVYDASDLDTILGSNILASLPKDRIGHGTHITSLAAGSGELYPGVASEAELIVVAGASESGGVSDTRILLGAKFVFERALELGLPAVVNVSLGSAFGAHDGESLVEQGLSELSRGPGRALVVASGNSGDLIADLKEIHPAAAGRYPGPFGQHTEVSVPEGHEVRVPVVLPPTDSELSEGTVFVWVSMYQGAELSVGFSNGEGGRSTMASPGDATGLESGALGDVDDYDVVILHGEDRDLDLGVEPGSAVWGLVGSWKRGRTFEVILEGKGTARLWLASSGSIASAQGVGPLLPRARRTGTVSVPGSDPHLITIGATINRNSWVDVTGAEVGFSPTAGGLASFSSAGPNQRGELKPELVAPGVGVIGAMALASDPRRGSSAFSQFAGACQTGNECLVVDDLHGVATGTSMAAPFAVGAVALLMQREPELSMQQAKEYLMAGATPLPHATLGSRHGTGELDVVGALRAQERALESDMDDVVEARLLWADDFVHPSPGPALQGIVTLRDQENLPAAPGGQVEVVVEGPGDAQWEFLSPGLGQLLLRADAGSSGTKLKVRLLRDGQTWITSEVPVFSDPILAEYGVELTGGSCRFGVSSQGSSSVMVVLLIAGACWTARRRRFARQS